MKRAKDKYMINRTKYKDIKRYDHKQMEDFLTDINKNIFEYVDPETGVHYLLFIRKEGYGGMGGITPRLDKSGQVMIDKEE